MRIEFGRTALEFHPTEDIDKELVNRLFAFEERRIVTLENKAAAAQEKNEMIDRFLLRLVEELAPYLGGLLRPKDRSAPADPPTASPAPAEDAPP